MEARAILRYARISPPQGFDRDGPHPEQTPGRSAGYPAVHPEGRLRALLKLVNSAAANAENNFNMDRNNLYVAECYVCPGPTLKRIMPRDHGRAYRILKRTSHMTVVLKEKE